MNLLHLQYFYTVAKEGGFSKASQVLRIDQSALSRMVRQLEDNLQMTLLERQPRGVKLTPTGEGVFARAAEIFSQVEQLRTETSQTNRICQGELRVGTTDLIAKHLLSDATAKMVREWPLLYPIVQVGSVGETLPLIANGRLEFGLFFHTSELPSSLVVTRRWPQRFHLVVSAKAAKDKAVLENFIGSREVDDTFNRHFPTLNKWQKRYPKAKIGISSNSLLFHYELVQAGRGISILPEFLVGKDLANKKLVDLLPEEEHLFDLKLVQRKSISLSHNAQTFLEKL